MIYYLYASVIATMLIAVWYDLSLEDEFLRNKKLSEADRLLIDALITKRASPRFFLRKAMFIKRSWIINKRVRTCLLVYFFAIIHINVITILYFAIFD